MILTASDIESLSRSLSRWEWGEYISEAFVIIACAGELIADLEVSWLTEERKKRLQRPSTILLVAALSVSLICLFRTNELSGSVIGSLGDKAEEADRKAKEAITDSSTALSQAKDALTKAGKAEDSLGKAEDEANKAQTASSNALTLARGARQEADSFEKDIRSAKEAVAEAKEKVADRTLTDGQAVSVAGKINSFAGQRVQIMTYFDASEPMGFANRILLALRLAKWRYLPPPEHTFLIGGITGIQVFINPEADRSTKNAAGALAAALNEQGIAATLKFDTAYAKNQIMINVGAKP
jgi:hypothetical protein